RPEPLGGRMRRIGVVRDGDHARRHCGLRSRTVVDRGAEGQGAAAPRVGLRHRTGRRPSMTAHNQNQDQYTPQGKNMALLLLAMTQFVIVIDASIVNVALPSIGAHLHFARDDLSWVVNAY